MSFLFDPTGKAHQNKIIGEEVVLGAKTPNNQLFVFFQQGPFFWEHVLIKHVPPTGAPVNLVAGVDFIPGYQFFDATARINRMVVGCIELRNITLTGKLVVVYQCLGSTYIPTAAQLNTLRANEKRDPQFTTWEMVCQAAGIALAALPTQAELFQLDYASTVQAAVHELRGLGLSVQLRPRLLDGTDEHLVIPTSDEVGLGLLSNYPISTESQARLGEHSQSYMTPQRTAQAIDSIMARRLREIGYVLPIAYASNLTISEPNVTVHYSGDVFSARPSALPVVTTGDFSVDREKFILLNTSNRAHWQSYSFTLTGTEPVDPITGAKLIDTGLVFDGDIDAKLIIYPNSELVRQVDYHIHKGQLKLIYACGAGDEFTFLWRRKNALMTGDRPYHHVIEIKDGVRTFTLPEFDNRSPDDVRLTLNEFVILTKTRDYTIANGQLTIAFPLKLGDTVEITNQDAAPDFGVLTTRSLLHSV